jgi:hypothetical protein
MASNFNDTTPAAVAGGTNVKWQTDGAGNDSAYILGSGGGGVLVKTADYNIAAADTGHLLQMNSASAHTITLLASAPTAAWWVIIKNVNTGILTIARNGLTIDGKSTNLLLWQGDSVAIFSDGSNYFTGLPRTFDIGAFAPGVGTNSQLLLRVIPTRSCIFPAGAPRSTGTASANATGNTIYTLAKNGSGFATIQFNSGGVTYTWTQASDATFNGTSDVLTITGPGTADATLADVGILLQGYRF